MAITTLQAVAVLNGATPNPFLDRVQMALVTTAQAVVSESTTTPLHYQRMQQAVAILNDPVSWRYKFAQDILGQLPLSTTNLVTVSGYTSQDLDTTDATLQTECSAVFNSFFQH